MTVKINPSKAVGKIIAPPSKSMAHRALICGALSEKSVIKNLAFSKDIEATLPPTPYAIQAQMPKRPPSPQGRRSRSARRSVWSSWPHGWR